MTTSKASKTLARIENDIEKSREEGNWIKVIELAEQLQRVKPGATTGMLKPLHTFCSGILSNAPH